MTEASAAGMRVGRFELRAPHFEAIRRHVERLGRYAERLATYHDLGIRPDAIRRRIDRVAADLASWRDEVARESGGMELDLPSNGSGGSIWDHRQSLRYAAGALMVTERCRARMGASELRRALRAKALCEFLLDLLDDLIDEGEFTFPRAGSLYRLCLGAFTSERFDPSELESAIATLLAPAQRPAVALLRETAVRVRALLETAPNFPRLRAEITGACERLAVGQALTTYQKDGSMDLRELQRSAAGFEPLDADLTWLERIARPITHGTVLSLIDLCFADIALEPASLHAHLRAWGYFDMTITFLNNLADVSKDLAAGLANIAIIALREPEVMGLASLRGREMRLTMAEYERAFARVAEFERRAVEAGRAAGPEAGDFYPFIAVMIPVVMLADLIERDEDMIHSYMRALAAARKHVGHHSTTYSQWSAPFRTHRVLVTLPEIPRAARTPS